MYNDEAIQKWSWALSDKCTLDRASFMLAGLIPLSYTEEIAGRWVIVVDMADLEKATKNARQGAEYLISEGMAKWSGTYEKLSMKGEDTYRKLETDYSKLIVGRVENMIKSRFFFELIGQDEPATTLPLVEEAVPEPEPEPAEDITDVVAWLNEKFPGYEQFAKTARIPGKPKQLQATIGTIINKIRAGERLVHTDLLTYLSHANAIICCWMDVPKAYSNIKERQAATNILSKISSGGDVLRVVNYFVEFYPETARQGYENTNIFNLSFHLTGMLTKIRGKKKTATNGDDRL